MEGYIRAFAQWFYTGMILVAKGAALGIGTFLLFILIWLWGEEISNRIYDWRHRHE